MHRRALLATIIALAPILSAADETISGQWEANLGHNVIVGMDVLADGPWTSQTVENNKVLAEMAGSCEQKRASATTGTLVFTPVKSKTTEEHGAAQIEEDKYTLERGGKVLRLVSTKNDVMMFRKQAYAK
jgi:hypothetical protein